MPRTMLRMSLVVFLLSAPPVLPHESDVPQADFGKIKTEIPVPSQWIVVKGSVETDTIKAGHVTFKEGKKLEIYWEIVCDGGSSFTTTVTREWEPDPKLDGSGIIRLACEGDPAPITGNTRYHGGESFRLLSKNMLKVKMIYNPLYLRLGEPFGEVFLTLERNEKEKRIAPR